MGNDWDTFGREKPYVQRVENPKWADPNRDFPSSYSRGGLNKDVVKHRKKASILYEQWSLTWLNEAYRVLQGGGVIKAFSGTRTFHRLAAAMEQVGFVDIRLEAWTYGSGFPKSLNIGKAIDRAAGAEREVVGPYQTPEGGQVLSTYNNWQSESIETGAQGRRVPMVTAPSTEEAKLWEGWGTALKPAWEPVLVGKKT